MWESRAQSTKRLVTFQQCVQRRNTCPLCMHTTKPPTPSSLLLLERYGEVNRYVYKRAIPGPDAKYWPKLYKINCVVTRMLCITSLCNIFPATVSSLSSSTAPRIIATGLAFFQPSSFFFLFSTEGASATKWY